MPRAEGARERSVVATCRGWRRGTGIEPAWNAATRSTLDLKSRPGTSRGNLAVADLTTGAVPGQPGYGVPNGILNADDFFYYLALFAAGC